MTASTNGFVRSVEIGARFFGNAGSRVRREIASCENRASPAALQDQAGVLSKRRAR
jgi:hypothetical protein